MALLASASDSLKYMCTSWKALQELIFAVSSDPFRDSKHIARMLSLFGFGPFLYGKYTILVTRETCLANHNSMKSTSH